MPNSNPQCQFCKILTSQSQNLLYKDDHIFAFHDIDKSTAQHHVLVCTVQHIQTALDIGDKTLLAKMKQVGIKVLDRLCQGKPSLERKYRFGFHLPPYNSIDHVHLHCFVLPFQSLAKDRIIYGKMLISIDEILERMDQKISAKL